jgi:hypothetical protein
MVGVFLAIWFAVTFLYFSPLPQGQRASRSAFGSLAAATLKYEGGCGR